MTETIRKIGNAYNRAWAFILSPITKPLAKRMGNPKDWTPKGIFKGLIIGLLLGKIGLWGMLLDPSLTNHMLTFWLWLPAMTGLNVTLLMAFLGWATVREYQRAEAKQ